MRDAKTLKPIKPEVVYLVKHEGPNHAQRRAAKKAARARQRKFNTWWRQLERAGIDPKRVLLARQIREEARIVAERLGAAGSPEDAGETPGVDSGNPGDDSVAGGPAGGPEPAVEVVAE